MSSKIPQPLNELLILSDEQFNLEVSEYILSDTFGSGPISDPHRIEIAKKWLARLVAENKDSICSNSTIVALMNRESELEVLGKAVLDGLLSDTSPVPASFITAHILRMGIRTLCSTAASATE